MAGLDDTNPRARQVQVELLRAMPVWRKVQLWGELNEAARQLALSGLRSRFPQADEAELKRRLADLLLGPELAERVYGPLRTTGHDC